MFLVELQRLWRALRVREHASSWWEQTNTTGFAAWQQKTVASSGLIWTSPWRRFNRQIDLIQRLCRLVSLFFKGLKSVEGASRGLCTHVWEMWKADCWVLIEGLELATMETGFECAKSEGRWKMEQRCLSWLPLSLGRNPCRIWCALSLGNFCKLHCNHLHVSCPSQQLTFVMLVFPPMRGKVVIFMSLLKGCLFYSCTVQCSFHSQL